MRRPATWLLWLTAFAPAPAVAQAIVTSGAADGIEITIYRDPSRAADEPMSLEWLNGFALVSERRRISIAAGTSDIRFEGVAGGIVPQSAIVTGLPEGIVERNRDAFLLSPATLLDRTLGRRVHLRRTSIATGEVREQEAVIRSGARGAVVLQTAQGFEALRCTGLPETLLYDEVPQGLSARPTLSVRARASQPVVATVTLTYLATGFDWQANYIATLSPEGGRVRLFAWLTLASTDETSFVNADAQAIAGRLNREYAEVDEEAAGDALDLDCWPDGTTSDMAAEVVTVASPVTVVNSQEVRLTGTTRTEDLINSLPQTFARQENLGDLKLYRISEPVTVAANSQKQVAFLERPEVEVELVYRLEMSPLIDEPPPVERLLITRNVPERGLGIPLPAGSVQLFTEARGRPILLGEGGLEDRAVGEEVEIWAGIATGVRAWLEEDDRQNGGRRERVLVVANDQASPVRFEAEFRDVNDFAFRPRGRLDRRDGRPLWNVTIPPHGRVSLRYRLIERQR